MQVFLYLIQSLIHTTPHRQENSFSHIFMLDVFPMERLHSKSAQSCTCQGPLLLSFVTCSHSSLRLLEPVVTTLLAESSPAKQWWVFLVELPSWGNSVLDKISNSALFRKDQLRQMRYESALGLIVQFYHGTTSCIKNCNSRMDLLATRCLGMQSNNGKKDCV